MKDTSGTQVSIAALLLNYLMKLIAFNSMSSLIQFIIYRLSRKRQAGEEFITHIGLRLSLFQK